MGNNGQYTVMEVLEITRDMLGDISVPVKQKDLYDQIEHARCNIIACIDALNRSKNEPETGEQADVE